MDFLGINANLDQSATSNIPALHIYIQTLNVLFSWETSSFEVMLNIVMVYVLEGVY